MIFEIISYIKIFKLLYNPSMVDVKFKMSAEIINLNKQRSLGLKWV